jgi:hypothetical protein
MDRDTANVRLTRYPTGAFLVRCRVSNGERLGFALSLKTDNDVKHMKVDTNEEEPDVKLYYFSETRKFPSVVELVAWYSRNSLRESFHGLDHSLQFPIGELSLVEAKYEFSPSPEDKNMLPLAVGEQVTIIDKMHGWQSRLVEGL